MHPYHLKDGRATVCEPDMCAGCMACVDVCPKNCIEIRDDVEHVNALIREELCIGCGRCHAVCQKNYPAEPKETLEAWQGWANPETRGNSSSGGFASAIMQSFVISGGSVVSCRLKDGDFGFAVACSERELAGFAGSKYVKSNPEGAYKAVLAELKAGRKTLFLGLPCQVSSMRNYVSEKYSTDLYCIDLICHGTPSVKVLRKALSEYGCDLDKVERIWFRRNTDFGLTADVHRIVPDGCTDRYTMAFLDGICYTRNCYNCYYAAKNRVGDLTLGDSWGTELKDEEPGGISLALVQTQKGREMLDMAGLQLQPVDYSNALANNHQLRHPTEMTPEHDIFFRGLKEKGSVKKAVFAVWPKRCLKQDAKAFLLQHGWKPSGGHPGVRNWIRIP